MRIVGLTAIALTATALVLMPFHGSTKWKHPGVAHPPKLKLEAVYVPDGTDAAISRGDITFTANKTPLSSLSLEEIFIVAGARALTCPMAARSTPGPA